MSNIKFARPHRPSVEELAQGVLAGNRALLGRAITLIESNAVRDQESSRALISRLLPHSGNAVRIGMFPNVPLELFHYIGNSSLAGAYTMALSDEANDRVEQVARNMTYMELSTHPGYMDAFVAACFLPHTDAARFASAE